MSRLELILSIILTLSILINVGLVMYIRGLLVRLIAVSEELGDLQTMVNSFTTHLQSVYELEAFYGDETLQHLLDHAVSFSEQMETFDYILALTEEEEVSNDEEAPDDEA